MKYAARKKLHWIGSGLAISGIVFVIIRMQTYWLELDLSRYTIHTWLAVGLLAVVYGFANIFLALAWRNLLQHLDAPVSRHWSISTYGISQLAKYLPGNIFHLAGRQALGMAAGLPPALLAKSTLWELGLIVWTAIPFSSLMLPIFIPNSSETLSISLLLGSAWLLSIGLRRFGSERAVAAFACHAAFLGVSAGIFCTVMGVISDTEVIPDRLWPTIGGAYIMAWLAGLVTPGAPAGVGVREMVLLFLLKGEVQEGDLIMAVLLGRLISVTGDFLFFVCASIVHTKSTITDIDDA